MDKYDDLDLTDGYLTKGIGFINKSFIAPIAILSQCIIFISLVRYLHRNYKNIEESNFFYILAFTIILIGMFNIYSIGVLAEINLFANIFIFFIMGAFYLTIFYFFILRCWVHDDSPDELSNFFFD